MKAVSATMGPTLALSGATPPPRAQVVEAVRWGLARNREGDSEGLSSHRRSVMRRQEKQMLVRHRRCPQGEKGGDQRQGVAHPDSQVAARGPREGRETHPTRCQQRLMRFQMDKGGVLMKPKTSVAVSGSSNRPAGNSRRNLAIPSQKERGRPRLAASLRFLLLRLMPILCGGSTGRVPLYCSVVCALASNRLGPPGSDPLNGPGRGVPRAEEGEPHDDQGIHQWPERDIVPGDGIHQAQEEREVYHGGDPQTPCPQFTGPPQRPERNDKSEQLKLMEREG